MNLNKKWKLYLIQHSHTDIGYTQRQELIELYHVHFIRQAIEISEAIVAGKKEWEGFHWTCECFWGVEKFLQEDETGEWRTRLEKAIEAGHVEITGNYLNFTELVDENLLRTATKRAQEFGMDLGLDIKAAMTADINGYSWGYPEILLDEGVENLFSCLHTHHGMHVGAEKQRPFWWKTQSGRKLLMWMGEHYHIGNELGFMKTAISSYSIVDEYTFNEGGMNEEDIFKASEVRIERYLNNLEQEGYGFDFVPAMVSGLMTDNGSPSTDIIEQVHRWNEKHGEQVEVEMISIHKFFEKVRSADVEIPTYEGDWPDWWAQGVSSTPLGVKMYREAARTLRVMKQLDPKNEYLNQEWIRLGEDKLLEYAEHTWGYCTSVTDPWRNLVRVTAARKESESTIGHYHVFKNYDRFLLKKGGTVLKPKKVFKYKVMNPYDEDITTYVGLELDGWEGGIMSNGFKVINTTTKEEYQWQAIDNIPTVFMHIGAKEEKVIQLEMHAEITPKTTTSKQVEGSERIRDISVPYDESLGIVTTEHSVETPYVKIEWSFGTGITSWYDKENQEEMLDQSQDHTLFTPVYEVTEAAEDSGSQYSIRRNMGRNQKGKTSKRFVGNLVDVRILTDKRGSVGGNLLSTVLEFVYEIESCTYYTTRLTVYKDTKRVDVAIRINKDNVWSPENLYVPLNFMAAEDKQLFFEKTNTIFEPRNEQLPYSNQDFYLVQEGIAFVNKKVGISVAIPDAPMIFLGDLAHKPVVLHDGALEQQEKNPPVYSWLMNNYWETNFKANLGECYEFQYHIAWGNERKKEALIQECYHMNLATVTLRCDK